MKSAHKFKPTEEYKRLEADVERIKKMPPHVPQVGPLPDNVLHIGDVLKPVVEKFGKKAEEMTTFGKKLDRWIAERVPEMCEEHEDVPLPVDRDRTFSESYGEKKLMVVYGHCPVCKREYLESLVNEKWRNMGMPHKVLNANFENFEVDTDAKHKALKKASSSRLSQASR